MERSFYNKDINIDNLQKEKEELGATLRERVEKIQGLEQEEKWTLRPDFLFRHLKEQSQEFISNSLLGSWIADIDKEKNLLNELFGKDDFTAIRDAVTDEKQQLENNLQGEINEVTGLRDRLETTNIEVKSLRAELHSLKKAQDKSKRPSMVLKWPAKGQAAH